MSKILLNYCHQLVQHIYTYTYKRCFLHTVWAKTGLILKADFYNNTLQNRLTLLLLIGLVSSDGAGALMDRMFSVYICIPLCLYVLLTAPNELTRHAAALLSLSWIRVSVDNWGGGSHTIIIHLYTTDFAYSIYGCMPSYHQQQ